MKYKLYRGYILGPGMQDPTHDIYEVNIYNHKEDVASGNEFHDSDSEWEAMSWLDSEHLEYGTATRADVDELNESATGVGDRVKEGVLLLVVDRDGVQLYSTPLGGYNVWDHDSQRELGKMIAEGLSSEAYE